jgi:ribonuclease BN (tRNA processing enzyme)
LQQIIEGQMAQPYFPVDMSVMAAERRFVGMEENSLKVNGAVVRFEPLNHPQGCVGYRVEADGRVLALATDTEPGSPYHDLRLRALARDADLLIFDSQYTPQQREGEKEGWGHSSWRDGVRIAQQEGVKRLALFHHDPESDDACVDRLVARAREEFPHTTGAAEGLEICLDSGEIREK